MQDEIVATRKQWNDHIEIAYLSLHALNTFKTQSSPIAVISPGEPFHIKEAGRDWLVNWYMVREKGLTLFGPPPQAIIEPISKDEFIQIVKEHVSAWREWIDQAQHRGFQAYAILTMCRALYTCTHGEQVSKRQAALWAAHELPEWSSTIHNALVWRLASTEEGVDDEATFPATRRFVHFMIDRILNAG
jgi:L-rhamnose mutarotase